MKEKLLKINKNKFVILLSLLFIAISWFVFTHITTLKNGDDYSVSYQNNIFTGTATIVITGKGQYSGTASGSDIRSELFLVASTVLARISMNLSTSSSVL